MKKALLITFLSASTIIAKGQLHENGDNHTNKTINIGSSTVKSDIDLKIEKNVNRFVRMSVLNSSSANAGSSIFVGKAGVHGGGGALNYFSPTYTSYPQFANFTELASYSQTNGLMLRTSAANGIIKFLTKGQLERMRINSDGKIGIGTTNPEHGKLQINGNGASEGIALWADQGEMTSRIWTNPTEKLFHITRGDNPSNGITLDNNAKVGIGTKTPQAALEVKHSNTLGGKWNPENSYLTLTSGTATMLIDPNEIYANSALSIGTNNKPIYFKNVNETGHENLMTVKQDGHVGIGTTNPEHGKLQINGNGASEGITLWTEQGEVTSRIWTNPTEKLFHITRGGDRLKGITLNNDGKVGIGTVTMGSHRLAVDGSIGAREIRVESPGWSDFVFETDYELKSLEEVETFIAKNGHLPDIPSEAEVETNGINVGEMESKLLQKIEELTLYVIEQNKANQELQKKNEEMQRRLERLEMLLNK